MFFHVAYTVSPISKYYMIAFLIYTLICQVQIKICVKRVMSVILVIFFYPDIFYTDYIKNITLIIEF